MKPIRRLLLSLLPLYFGSFIFVQQPVAQQVPNPAIPPLLQRNPSEHQPATITTNVLAVVLDVVVTDSSGHDVHGLKQSDFHLVEDGAPQSLNSFHEHIFHPTNTSQLPKLPTNAFTNFVQPGSADVYTVILIDDVNNSPQVQTKVRSQLINFMKTLPAGNNVAIFQLESAGMRLIQGFSSDPSVLLQAVESKREQIVNPLIGIQQQGYVTQQFRQDSLLRGLKSMGLYLAGFPGRKNLIWFSGSIPRTYWGGGPDSPFPDGDDFAEEISQASDTLTLSRVAVYPIDARGLESDPANNATRRGMPSTDSVTNFEGRRFYDHADIEDIAESTGGKAFYNNNGLKEAMDEVIASSSNFYTIAYTPTNKNWNGNFRNIRIEVSQPGLKLEYRRGYFALAETAPLTRRGAATSPAQTGAGSDGNFADAMQLGSIPPTQILFDVSISPGRTSQKLEKNDASNHGENLRQDLRKKPLRNYSVLFAVDSHTLSFTQAADGVRHGTLDFVTRIYDDQGVLANSITATVQLNLKPTTYDEILHRGMSMKQLLAVPATGSYFFRFGVHDTVNDSMGALEVPVDNVKLGVSGPGQASIP
jgi:VWFA-related protein